jgi:hypothetical protein
VQQRRERQRHVDDYDDVAPDDHDVIDGGADHDDDTGPASGPGRAR